MRLRTKFILVITILHLVALALSFYIFQSNLNLFIVSELGILVSIFISWQLYKQMLKPLQTIVAGIEAIKDKDFNVKFLRTGTYEMDQLIDVYNEMMDHLKTERIRQEQQHFFLEKLIHTSPTGIIILDFDAKVQQVNPKACTILGVIERELLGQPIAEIDKPLLNEISKLKSGEGKTASLDGVHTFKLQRSHFIDRGFARSFVMIEELTAEILAAEKKAYGKVIRMMAHEVNNTIGPVNSIIESTLKRKDLWKKTHESLEHALQVAFDRNLNLNIFMRNFADVVRLPQPNKTIIDINQLVQRVITLFHFKAMEARICFNLQLPIKPFPVYADQQQLEQALINIIKNSMESIGMDGVIIIATFPEAHKITITDSGKGILDEHATHLFSPFFSTKKDGQGVGLTLVKEILLNHNFQFSLKT
ncbi:MAG TPA: ATP-binding protein, partial [Chitinophagaceae bacterium]|nr:ATP-binding protein [Chitinophagaceae bacterium]